MINLLIFMSNLLLDIATMAWDSREEVDKKTAEYDCPYYSQGKRPYSGGRCKIE
jgi:hypothetical protein